MNISKKLIVSATVLSSLHAVAAGNMRFEHIKPRFDIGSLPTISESVLERFRKNKIEERNSFFIERANQKVLQKAKQRAIQYLDENWEERNHRFKNDQEYAEFKERFLGGEYEPTRVIENKNGQRVLKSIFASVEDLGFSLLEEQDFKNRLTSYENIYKLLPEDVKNMVIHPDRIKDFGGLEYNFSIIYDLLKRFRDLPIISVNPYPEEYVQKCEDEIGYQAPLSSSGRNNVADNAARCDYANYHDKGLFRNNDYPLKYNTTCIKDQANRGTCVSFTINAAIETIGYTHDGLAYNLSEQFTYFYAEVFGGSSNGKKGRYDYGLNNNKSLKVLDNENASLQLEKKWPYNPSWNMADTINSNEKWANSCDGYDGPQCTNRAFQAREEKESCGWFCTNYIYTVPSRSSSNSFEVTGRNSFWSSWNKEGSLDQAITYLNAGIPVLAGFDVRTYMYNKASASGNGYIRFQDSNDANEGGHAFLLIGFVKNSDLPEGVTRATEEGYFIVKNSWGIGAGDCGYLYIDYKYMRKETDSLHTISARRP